MLGSKASALRGRRSMSNSELGYGIVCDNWQDGSLVENAVQLLNVVGMDSMEVGVSERWDNGTTRPVCESRERPDAVLVVVVEESPQQAQRGTLEACRIFQWRLEVKTVGRYGKYAARVLCIASWSSCFTTSHLVDEIGRAHV